MKSIYNYLTSYIYERDEVIYGMLVALIARKNMILIGPPGTAKSYLISEMAKCIEGVKYFQWLLTKFSTPDELFGPISLKGLEQDVYRRNTSRKLPEAHISFLDEVFKANSAILNSLLTLMNERIFYNDSHTIQAPLISLFGASNEYPDPEENLAALWTRFHLRYEVNPLAENGNFVLMLKDPPPGSRPQMLLSDLIGLQNAVIQVQVNEDVFAALVNLKNELSYLQIKPTDRTWRDALELIKARAVLEGRETVQLADLEILKHVLWSEPSQRKDVAAIVQRYLVDVVTAEIKELMGEAWEIYNNVLMENSMDNQSEANRKFKLIMLRINDIAEKHQSKRMLAKASISEVRRLSQVTAK